MTSRFPQPCVDCGALTRAGSRCEAHQAQYTRKRNGRNAGRPERIAHKSSYYNYAYRKAAQAIRETATHCHICHEAFKEGDRVEADHLIAGNPESPLAPAHRLCNQRRGAGRER